LIDFGIAKGNERDAGATTGAVLKGKVGYFAPEQLQELEIDRRVDVFAAGVVLHEIIAGRRLFGGDDHAKSMMRVLLGDTPQLSSLRDDVPEALDAVIEQALSRDREDRYATAADFLEALAKAVPPASTIEVARYVERWCGEVLETRRIEMRALVAAPPKTKRSRRKAMPLAVGVALATLAIGGIAFSRYRTGASREEPPTATASAPVAAGSASLSATTASITTTTSTSATTSTPATTAATGRPLGGPRRGAHPATTSSAGAAAPSPAVPATTATATSPLHENPYGSARPP
jgi:serine/threonine-protein kinase